MYKAIFENTGTAMVINEKDMSISLINDDFSKLSGFTRKDIEGKKSWTEFFSKYDLYVGGFFGRFLNVANAQEIGLLPMIPPALVELCGNTALACRG